METSERAARRSIAGRKWPRQLFPKVLKLNQCWPRTCASLIAESTASIGRSPIALVSSSVVNGGESSRARSCLNHMVTVSCKLESNTFRCARLLKSSKRGRTSADSAINELIKELPVRGSASRTITRTSGRVLALSSNRPSTHGGASDRLWFSRPGGGCIRPTWGTPAAWDAPTASDTTAETEETKVSIATQYKSQPCLIGQLRWVVLTSELLRRLRRESRRTSKHIRLCNKDGIQPAKVRPDHLRQQRANEQ